jgi:predicted DNA-binding transcriptional regulator YafY
VAAHRGLQAEADPDLHALRALRPLLQQEPDVVPGRGALRARAGVRLRQDPGGAAREGLPYLGRIQELFSARPEPWKDYSGKREVISALIDATLHQRRARIEYFSFHSKKTKTYRVDPYRLVYWHGGLYLYARAEEYDEVRTFAVERIEKIEVLDETFQVPADFNVSEYARGAFGIAGGRPEAVELVFDADMASYIRERVWHESQALEEADDGKVVLRMSVAPGWELKSWIKGFLPHVRIVKPAALRDEIGAELEKARKRFSRKG